MDTIANSTVPEGSTEQWRDKKRYLWLIGLVVPSLAFAGYGLWLWTGLARGSGSGRW
jgi:alkane 1-monooxygenase